MTQIEVEIVAVFAVVLALYWVLVRPRLDHRRIDMQKLQVGDEVLTTSGFLGTVKDVYIPESGPVQLVIDFGSGVVVHALASAIKQRVAAGQTLHSHMLQETEEQGS